MNSVIIVAAGSGNRMNAPIGKQFIEISGKEIIARTIDVFYNNKNINEIVLAIKQSDEEFVAKIIKKNNYKGIKLVYGGKERQDSIYNCLKYISQDSEIILIHDGVRPFVTDETIEKAIKMAKEKEAVCIGVPIKDTIKVVRKGIITDTPDRDLLWSAQTPQAFKRDLIIKAHEYAKITNFRGTDDAMLVENIGKQVHMIQGKYDNVKITVPEDILVAKSILEKRS